MRLDQHALQCTQRNIANGKEAFRANIIRRPPVFRQYLCGTDSNEIIIDQTDMYDPSAEESP